MELAQLWDIGLVVFVSAFATCAAALGLAKVLRWLDSRSHPSEVWTPLCTDQAAWPIAILYVDGAGGERMIWTGDVEVYCIDERCQGDRVYRYSAGERSRAEIAALVGEDEIGRLGDRPAAEQAIRAAFFKHQGKRPSLVVSDDPEAG